MEFSSSIMAKLVIENELWPLKKKLQDVNGSIHNCKLYPNNQFTFQKINREIDDIFCK